MADFKVTSVITEERIAMILVGAWEGGSNYWCEADGQPYRLDDEKLHLPVPCRVTEEDPEGEFPRLLTLESLQRGLQILADAYPWHFASIVEENDDSETSDALLQCALLSEIVYG